MKITDKLKKKIGPLVNERLNEFRNNDNFFSELCFCILTANFSAERSIKIEREVNFFEPEKKLALELKRVGHRFPNTRAKYIVEAREKKNAIRKAIESLEEKDLREWLVKNIKGLGYKEASHFLRNIGYSDVAIIDYHIIDLLVREGIIERPKRLAKKDYYSIEKVLRSIAEKNRMSLAELDLYLWYMETGKVLK